MNDFLDVWLDYWNNNPNSSDIYTEGAQDNWDYNWEQIFDQLGIEHPQSTLKSQVTHKSKVL